MMTRPSTAVLLVIYIIPGGFGMRKRTYLVGIRIHELGARFVDERLAFEEVDRFDRVAICVVSAVEMLHCFLARRLSSEEF